MKDIVKELQQNELFKGVNPDEIDELLCNIGYSIKKYSKNEIVAQEDDTCKNLALILEGVIEIQRLYSNGKYIVLSRLTQGSVFGEALVFSTAKTYPATVVSLNDSRILFITKEDVLKLCTDNQKILENFISLLSNKVFILNSKIKSISFRSVRQQVINFILEEVRDQKSNLITLKNTKEEIASSLGLPRPSLSRELINLRNLGYIEFNRKIIKVLDIKGLEEELFN